MQSNRIEFPLRGRPGAVVIVEVADDTVSAGQTGVARDGALADHAGETLQDALSGIRPIAEALMNALAKLEETPHEITAEFGIKLNARGGVTLAKAAAEGNVIIKLTWNPDPASVLSQGSRRDVAEV